MATPLKTLAILAFFFGFSSLLSAQSTYRVTPPGGGGDFHTIQDAVNASQTGDIILIEAFSYRGYPGFVVNGKGITLRSTHASLPGQKALVYGPIQLRNIPLGSQLNISGISIEENHRMEITSSPGVVSVENAKLNLLRVQNVGTAILQDIQAGTGRIEHSKAFLQRTTFRGEDGEDGWDTYYPQCRSRGTGGKTGLTCRASTVHAKDSSFHGGNGGGGGIIEHGQARDCYFGLVGVDMVAGNGGSGIELNNTQFFDYGGVQYQGGSGGWAGWIYEIGDCGALWYHPCCLIGEDCPPKFWVDDAGEPGNPGSRISGSSQPQSRTAPHLTLEEDVEMGQNLKVSVQHSSLGENDIAFFLLANKWRFRGSPPTPKVSGYPLFLFNGQFFEWFYNGGTFLPTGRIETYIQIPNRIEFVGFPLGVQALVYRPHSQDFLVSNPDFGIVGENNDNPCDESGPIPISIWGHRQLRQVTGNGDNVFDPGEIWELTPRIRNDSCRGIVNATGTVSVNPQSGPVEMVDPEAYFGFLDSWGILYARNSVRFRIDHGFQPGDSVILDLVQFRALKNLRPTGGVGFFHR